MKTRELALCALVCSALCACQLIVGTTVRGTAAAVGATYYVGHSVYEGGAAVASAVGDAVASPPSDPEPKEKYDAVTISKGTFHAKCKASPEELYAASEQVFQDAGFGEIEGKRSADHYVRTGKAASGDDAKVSFRRLDTGGTEVDILIGGGNLKHSEFLYDRILASVSAKNPEVAQ